jgi:hypothetical protein
MLKYSALAGFILIALMGCSHVAHEANIKKGLNGSVLIVPKRTTTVDYGYAQFGLGE